MYIYIYIYVCVYIYIYIDVLRCACAIYIYKHSYNYEIIELTKLTYNPNGRNAVRAFFVGSHGSHGFRAWGCRTGACVE